MSHSASSTPSLTPSRSPSPEPPVQPDHFYGNDNASAASSPDGKPWLDPADDPLAQRGIPVFKPTMEEFADFEAYMSRVECWGMRSGIVKVIPPKEWTESLPAVIPQLENVKLKSPIEQHMIGHGGLFRQQNIEKRKVLSVREWAELCAKDGFRAPGKDEIGLRSAAPPKRKTRRSGKKAKDAEAVEEQGAPPDIVVVKDETEAEDGVHVGMDLDDAVKNTDDVPHTSSPTDEKPLLASTLDGSAFSNNNDRQSPTSIDDDHDKPSSRQSVGAEGAETKRSVKGRQAGATKEDREAQNAERAAKDKAFLEEFKPLEDWLPPQTTNADYTPELCRELERRYWRNCGLGKPPWYGADMQGSLFTDDTTAWNVAHLPSALSRLLPSSSKGLPGVNTPYLYFGMWRATFAWHVEDMDLFSINYIHFGAPKYWYAMPQARSGALEQNMKGYFPRDIIQCPQFLRHKSFLASPTVLGTSSCRPNVLVQRQGEFVITFPKGYHAGFNLGFNCAESVNFALDSWLDLGRRAKVCECVNFSVRIDVDQLLADRAAEQVEAQSKPIEEERKAKAKAKTTRKRKAEDVDEAPASKKLKIRIGKPASSGSTASAAAQPNVEPTAMAAPAKPKVFLRLGPPKEIETFPCCLCVSMRQDGLLRVVHPPIGRREIASGSGKPESWMAHEECANVVPETWIDEIEVGSDPYTDAPLKERVVYGVDGIVKDRWNLKCNACSKAKNKAHGAPIQCTKGRCPKAFHVSCARDGTSANIVYTVVREIDKEVILLDSQVSLPETTNDMAVDSDQQPDQQPPSHVAMLEDGVADTSVAPNQNIVKLVKKLEVCVLCSQHNPAVSDAKKAQKQEKIKNELLSLPPLARIKLRVSAGVFEVTLVRVVEETGCVEVLWDRGVKREFRWGSVVFGKTEEVVGHKPMEPAMGVDLNRPVHATPVPQTSSTSSVPFAPLTSSTGTIEIRQTSMAYQPPPPSMQPQASATSYPHTVPGPAMYRHQFPPGHNPPPPQHSQHHVSHYQQHQPYTSSYQYGSSWSYQYHGPPGSSYGAYPNYDNNHNNPMARYHPPPQQQPQQQQQHYSTPVSTVSTPASFTPTNGHAHGMDGSVNTKQLQVHLHQHQQNQPPPQQLPQPQHIPQPQLQPQPRHISRGLQWQRPYTGPKA